MRKTLMLVAVALGGCASARVPPLTDAAEHVQRITAEQSLLCQFVRNVEYVKKISGRGKSYDLVHEAGEHGLRNQVAGVGGNAYVNVRMDADEMWGKIDYSGEAFKCSPEAAARIEAGAQPWRAQ